MRKRDPLIYRLIDPTNNDTRYIGQSVYGLKRARGHLWPSNLRAGQTRCDRWIKKLLANGHVPIAEVVERCEESALNERERWWITFARAWGCDLTNLADGGKSGSGWRASDEKRAKLKQIQNRPETKAKIRATQDTPEAKEHHRKAVAAALADPEIKARQRAGAKQSWTPEKREAQRLRMIARWASPEWHARKLEIDKNPEVRARRSAAQKSKWTEEARAKSRATRADPDFKSRHRAALLKALNRPDVKEKQRLGMLAAWARPEDRKRRSLAMAEGRRRRRERERAKKTSDSPTDQ